jgi:hypothetical protein
VLDPIALAVHPGGVDLFVPFHRALALADRDFDAQRLVVERRRVIELRDELAELRAGNEDSHEFGWLVRD